MPRSPSHITWVNTDEPPDTLVDGLALFLLGASEGVFLDSVLRCTFTWPKLISRAVERLASWNDEEMGWNDEEWATDAGGEGTDEQPRTWDVVRA